MDTVTGRRAVNLVVYFLALAWVVMASLAWNFGDLGTRTMFRVCGPAVGVVIGCIVVDDLLDRMESRRSNGFEVMPHEKKRL
jgi:hypothetical protein